jgi:hypothetical protein
VPTLTDAPATLDGSTHVMDLLLPWAGTSWMSGSGLAGMDEQVAEDVDRWVARRFSEWEGNGGRKPQGGKISLRHIPRAGFGKDYVLQTRLFDILALPLPENTSNLLWLGIPPLGRQTRTTKGYSSLSPQKQAL